MKLRDKLNEAKQISIHPGRANKARKRIMQALQRKGMDVEQSQDDPGGIWVVINSRRSIYIIAVETDDSGTLASKGKSDSGIMDGDPDHVKQMIKMGR